METRDYVPILLIVPTLPWSKQRLTKLYGQTAIKVTYYVFCLRNDNNLTCKATIEQPLTSLTAI